MNKKQILRRAGMPFIVVDKGSSSCSLVVELTAVYADGESRPRKRVESKVIEPKQISGQ